MDRKIFNREERVRVFGGSHRLLTLPRVWPEREIALAADFL